MEKFFPILKQCPLFAHIAESDLSAMLHCLQVTVQHYDKGQIVIHEGEKAERFGIVLTGAVQLWRIDYSGNRSIMANVEPAQIFGKSFVCAEVESIPIQAVASASCDVMLIDGSRILHACGNGCEFHQQVIFHLLQIIARKNLVFHQKLEITSKRTTREKLLTYLNQQAQRHRCSTFTIPFDRQELADFLEVDRSGLSAEISKLRKEGVLESERSTFRLL